MTENDKKLIEAAKLIKERCAKCEADSPCCFAIGGRCDGIITNCGIGDGNLFPSDWDIPEPSRWTDADVALAKALMEFGVEKVKNFKDECAIIYESEDGTYPVKNVVPKGAFIALNPYETVYLKDIVADGENNG